MENKKDRFNSLPTNAPVSQVSKPLDLKQQKQKLERLQESFLTFSTQSNSDEKEPKKESKKEGVRKSQSFFGKLQDSFTSKKGAKESDEAERINALEKELAKVRAKNKTL
jgi:hypothetical protein